MDLRFAPIWPWPLTLGLAGALFAFAFYTYPAASPNRKLLLGLRLTAIFAALFAFARPSLEFKKTIEQSSTLLFLYDKSRSMTLRDMWRNLSRFEAMRDVREDAKSDMAELANRVVLREYGFDRKVVDLAADAWKDGAVGNQTALGDALDDLGSRFGDDRLAGIVVLSDGVTNTGTDPAEIRRQLAGRNIPVHCFGFGSEVASEQIRDILPTKIDTNAVGFKKNRMPVRAEFSVSGFGGRKLPVKLLFDGEEKGRGEIKSTAGGNKGTIEIMGIPEKPGDVKVTLEAEPQPGELLINNNSISTYITVRSEGLSVLHLEGKYRFWEPKFVRRAIDQSPDIDLTQVFLLDTAGRVAELPDDLLQPGKFDVIIIGDLGETRLPAATQEKLVGLVRGGAGLMMIGGYESFGPGGWDKSPLAEFLPVQMRAADGNIETELKFVPSDAGLLHFVLRLAADPQANRKIWDALRPLDGGNTWAGLKQSALVLAETPQKQPLLVAQEIGKNRSLAFASDTTWRWAMKDRDGKKLHARLWRQLMLWLAHREDAGSNQVRIRLDRRRANVGERIPVEVAIIAADGKPIPNLRIEAVIKSADKPGVPVALTKQGETFRGLLPASDVAGDFEFAVQAIASDKPLGAASAKYLIFDEDLEMRQLAADFDSLRKLSADTGGEYHSAEEFPKFIKALKSKDLRQEVTKPVIERLWDRWELLALFIAAIGVEWLVRKRVGLV